MDSLELGFSGYNDGIAPFISSVLKSIQSYTIDRDFFENKRALMIRSYENEGKKEPYMRLSTKKYEALLTAMYSNQEALKVLKEDMTFELFNQLKAQWLSHMRLEWLLMGHLFEEEALKIVSDAESVLKYKPIDKLDLHLTRLVQIPERSVNEYNEVNEDPSNPNSAVVVIL